MNIRQDLTTTREHNLIGPCVYNEQRVNHGIRLIFNWETHRDTFCIEMTCEKFPIQPEFTLRSIYFLLLFVFLLL